MGNSTTFLTLPAHQLLGTQIVYAEKKVDFSLENTAAAGTLDVLRLPKGCIPLMIGAIANTHQDTVTYALNIPTASITGLPATAHTADNQVIMTTAGADDDKGGFVTKLLAADDTLQVTIGAATASTAVVTFFCVYAVSDAAR